MPSKRTEPKTVVAFKDDVVRIDICLDEDLDVEILQFARIGSNRWERQDPAVTISPTDLFAALFRLRVIDLPAELLVDWPSFWVHFKAWATKADIALTDLYVLDRVAAFVSSLAGAGKAVLEEQQHGQARDARIEDVGT